MRHDLGRTASKLNCGGSEIVKQNMTARAAVTYEEAVNVGELDAADSTRNPMHASDSRRHGRGAMTELPLRSWLARALVIEASQRKVPEWTDTTQMWRLRTPRAQQAQRDAPGVRFAAHPAARRAWDPARSALGAIVGVLIIVLLAALGSLVLIHVRPLWFVALRNSIATSPGPAQVIRPLTVPTRMRLVSSSMSGATYSLPTDTYALVVTVDAPCWITVDSPSEARTSFGATLLPTSSPMTLNMHGSSSVTIAARAVSIRVSTASRSLGVINGPIVGYRYTFDPVRN